MMRIALVAPPFITVPPAEYGGTELFIAHLARGLKELGVDVVVYTNGESTIDVEERWLFDKAQWPLRKEDEGELKDIDHTTWAVKEACTSCDIIHLNNAPGLVCSRFVDVPFVYTLHHATNAIVSAYYSRFPNINYVAISDDQRRREQLPKVRTIHHGIDLSQYRLQETKQPYLSFIGRIAPIKGTHLAIEIAKKAGIPLKIAGEVQPMYREYFERKVKPHIDGSFVEYIGVADLTAKNELLGNSMATLFPIEWNEPFGLVMVEAMACGTPVLAFRSGSVPEIVRDSVSGYVGRRVNDLAKRAQELHIPPATVRRYVEENFSVERMSRDYLELYAAVVQHERVAA
jgi:glycosyltransferase involved in cell wall biosynthesis